MHSKGRARDSRKIESELIGVSPEILHGTPVFAGTRVPVTTLFDYLKGGDRLDDFLDDFPTVSREHAVLRDGYELSAKSELVRQLRETRRRLELEHAVLAAPERIQKLATQLGMTRVAPDRIRVVVPNKVAER